MSKIEVNEIVKSSGSTLTIGGCGTAVTLGSGATQTGFGRSGSVNWQTSDIKTSTFTAANGEGYFINASGSITMNLPAGSAGAIVAVADYARNFATHNFIISPNGSEKIGGVAASLTLNVNGQGLTLVYVDSTKGWVNVQNAEDTETGTPPFVAATGGNSTAEVGDFKIHTFTSPGTFQITNAGTPGGSNTIDYLVVAGGGAGGNDRGGGGGAGGVRFFASPDITSYPASPRNAPAALSASVSSIPVTVGAGGAGSPSSAADGSDSIFSTITSTGGGRGGIGQPSNAPGGNGGSGGGARDANGCTQGSGNTPPVSPSQGSNGGASGPPGVGGGGGGFMEAGKTGGSQPATACKAAGGDGGGFPTSFVSTSGQASSCEQFFGGGGAGGTCNTSNPFSGLGGGGFGGSGSPPQGLAATTNTGGGGGGNINGVNAGGNGGSGIVIIRYKFQ
jgi:hypothetical protein